MFNWSDASKISFYFQTDQFRWRNQLGTGVDTEMWQTESFLSVADSGHVSLFDRLGPINPSRGAKFQSSTVRKHWFGGLTYSPDTYSVHIGTV